MKSNINIISILWGKKYKEVDVNRLFYMIRRNTSHNISFHLFTNEELPELDPEIIRHNEPGKDTNIYKASYNYRKEAALCDNLLGGLTRQRVFFFDLDVLIMKNLDDLFDYPKEDKFYIINDWNTRGDHVGQATCYSFVVGTLGYIKDHYEENSQSVVQQFGTASQEYLSHMVIQEFSKLEFWPESWCRSFRFHCLPWGLLRHFITPSLPSKETRILAFHGHPDIDDAINGRWSPPDSKKAAKGWKHIYKACRPTGWIKDYWH